MKQHNGTTIRRFRRGSAALYMVVMLPVAYLMVSLAVDFGRAQTAKTQLHAVVDAAARAAGQQLINFQSNDVAQAAAISVAAANSVDGRPVVLQPSDIEFGYWDANAKSFTANSATTNAVRVTGTCTASRGTAIPTSFSSVAGNSSVDIRASATAYIAQEMAPFNANGNVTFNTTGLSGGGGTWQTDSYVGNLNAFAQGSERYNGHLLTNGSVKYNFTTPADGGSGWANVLSNVVMGTIYSANGADCAYAWNNQGAAGAWVQYGGWNNPGPATQGLGTTTSFTTPVMPVNNTNPAIPVSYLGATQPNGLKDLTVSDGSQVHLPAGTYTLNSISVTNGSTVVFDGPVTLDVAANLNINGASMMPSSNDPKYMKINLCNTGSAGANAMNITNLTNDLYADLNGPLADLNFSQPKNGKSILGRIYANNMNFNCTGNGGIHGDESLLMSLHMVK